MKFLVIGLGSMGKRRIRCLKALGYSEILGLDPREDRREEVKKIENINVIENIKDVDLKSINSIILSTPPDKHIEYMKIAVDNDIPAFIEASVILKSLDEINIKAKEKNLVFAPSCTLSFHPAIKEIKKIVLSKKYGNFTNFSYHSGQYLPDWHPWEDVKDFYVSNKETGACREIVPFELTWLLDIFGLPTEIKGYYSSNMNVGADIDDTYATCMKFEQGIGTLLVDVVSRYAVRNLVINMEYGQIMWRWDEPVVNLYDARDKKWIILKQEAKSAADGYNKNITEQMYIDEVNSYINAVKGVSEFPNNLSKDIDVLNLLYSIEKNK